MAQINIEDLKKTMPWREIVHPTGVVQMVDAFGREVSIFAMTGLLQIVTEKMARKPAPQPEQG